MIAELQSYENDAAIPVVTKKAIKCCREFLTALNSMFINGTISHQKIWSENSTLLQNMSTGLQFFIDWHRTVQQAVFVRPVDRRLAFIAPETFDSLRFLIFGWIKLCKLFFHRFPSNYYLVPHRISGSPVENIFSMFRYYAAGNPTSLNYDPILTRLRAINAEGGRLKCLQRRAEDGNESPTNLVLL